MEMRRKKTPSLFLLFLRYLTCFCIANILSLVALICIYFAGMMTGVIWPANFQEQMLRRGEEVLKNSQPFDDSVIPFTCEYVLFDREGSVVKATMDEQEIRKAAEVLAGGTKKSYVYYFTAEREDGTCMVRYDMLVHFSSAGLHRIFPKPELLMICIFIIIFVLLTIITALMFGKRLKIQLAPLIAATEAIKRQELTFEITPTNVREFNTVLESMEDMRIALKASLEQQWDVEQARQTQIAALAHDIKTPLTLVKGNVELLLETEFAEEPGELAETIHRSALKMEQYIELLMDTATMEDPRAFSPEEFAIKELLKEIAAQAKAVCLSKNLSFVVETDKLPEHFWGDKSLIYRALMNILDNGAEYSPVGGELSLTGAYRKGTLTFTVTDMGKGFTASGLRQAARLFVTEQKERSGKHYGMGLYLAKTVAEKHGGELILDNRGEGSGAVVTLVLFDRTFLGED